MKVLLPGPDFNALREHVKEADEVCAVGFITESQGRAVVRGLQTVPSSAYVRRSPVAACLSPSYCVEIANAARRQNAGIVLAHTHPGTAPLNRFSDIDDEGERKLADYFGRRVAGTSHYSLLVTRDTVRCRALGTDKYEDVLVIGDRVVAFPANQPEEPIHEQFDRQVRAFGLEGQRALGGLRVGIVGAGGTGSFVCMQLAHLGVRNYVLIDPDVVEVTNLNRLVGATASDVGMNKADLAKREICAVQPHAECRVVKEDVTREKAAGALLDCDFIFLCTDSHASRAVINQLCYQYLIPGIDTGVAIHVKEGQISHVAGRVQMLAPGLGCLVCANWINSEQVRREMLDPDARMRDPYIVGYEEKQPAVISLNGLVTSAAVSMFLSAIVDFPGRARMLIYDGVAGSLRPTVMPPQENCVVCSRAGALSRATAWPLPTH